MAPIIASSLIGAGSSILSKGLNALFERVGRKDDGESGQGKFGITGQNLPGTGSKSPASAVEDIVKAVDADGDGTITKAEMKDYFAQQKQALQAQLIRIQAEHSNRAHAGKGQAGENRIERLYSKLDTNGDGTVTSDELSAYLKTMAQRLRGPADTAAADTAGTSSSSTTAATAG
jgi:Ca2+-binding EF-hand superfamily protein